MRHLHLHLLLPLLALPGTASAQRVDDPGVLVTAEWLMANRTAPKLVLVHLAPAYDTTGARAYIPGSSSLRYADLAVARDGRQAELPKPDALARVLSQAGISNDSRVVLYSADPITAARAFVALESAGAAHVSVLDGGPAAWRAAGGPLHEEPDASVRPGRFTVQETRPVVVEADWVQDQLQRQAPLALIDTRTVGEYDGTGTRRGLPSTGHLAGAQLLLWQELLQEDRRFKPRAVLDSLFRARGARADATVVTYCYIGYRASITYFVARLLGYEARIYDGSYDDWSQRGLPLVTGLAPR